MLVSNLPPLLIGPMLVKNGAEEQLDRQPRMLPWGTRGQWHGATVGRGKGSVKQDGDGKGVVVAVAVA